MARRSSGVVDAGASGYPPGGFSSGDPWDTTEEKGRRGKRRGGSDGGGGDRRGWGGSGGRWFIYVGRVILWAFLIVVLVNGIRAPFERFTENRSTTATTGDTAKPKFPETAASAYALSFAEVYLNYDQANAAERQRQLAQFISGGIDPQLGWDGTGKSVLQSAHVASVRASDTEHGVVTLLARANGRLFQLAVPVYVKDGAMAITGRPATLPPPATASVPPAAQDRDSGLENDLQQPLNDFFKAYAASDAGSLQRYSDPPVTGLGNTVTFGQLKEVTAPRGDAASRTVTATVVWQIPAGQGKTSGGTLEQTYQLAMVKKAAYWFVRDIQGSPLPAGS
ncbi:conjugal transfer protein [Actinoallomurus spadix]|uniref:Conjugative transposon protein TcpC n=1 Tax=Actinoallomurus spadix TaxID=79912 RepID=A0ABN0X6U6_9ACTN|nr:conjugal transfer protein [Actinoallomurus spadix]MCO5986997.1 conjugal transfer protein [Actinoallomurus spadix]